MALETMPNFNESGGDAAAAAAKENPTGLFFGRLPAELRERIHVLAYPDDVKITQEVKNSCGQFKPDITGTALAPYPRFSKCHPGVGIDTFLVSKMWLAGSLPTLVRKAHFDFGDVDGLKYLGQKGLTYRTNIQELTVGVEFYGNNRSWNHPPALAELLNACPRLKKVTLRWTLSIITRMTLRLSYHGSLGRPAEHRVREAERLRGLRQIALEFDGYGIPPETLKRDLEVIQTRLAKAVYQPRDR